MPGGIRTDFAGRSPVMTRHPAYAAMVARVFQVFAHPERRAKGASAEQIAAVVYAAATDGQDRLTCVAGDDA